MWVFINQGVIICIGKGLGEGCTHFLNVYKPLQILGVREVT